MARSVRRLAAGWRPDCWETSGASSSSSSSSTTCQPGSLPHCWRKSHVPAIAYLTQRAGKEEAERRVLMMLTCFQAIPVWRCGCRPQDLLNITYATMAVVCSGRACTSRSESAPSIRYSTAARLHHSCNWEVRWKKVASLDLSRELS